MVSRKLSLSIATLVAVFCALSSLWMTQETHADDAQIKSAVTSLLSGLEYAPTPEEWRALGPEAAEILRQTASDPTQLATTRARAISALANFDDPATRPFLEAVLSNEAHPEILRRNAVTVLSLRHGAEVLPLIAPFTASPSFTMRETAIRATARLAIDSPDAKALLATRLPVEPSDTIKTVIEQSLNTAPSTTP